MSNLIFMLPFVPVFTLSGILAPGANAFFYLTGTSTKFFIYDENGDVQPNPAPADGQGRLPQIYIPDTITTYRLRLETSDGTLIDDIDPYTNLGGSGGSAIIGFLQAGAGAVKRTAEDKMRDWADIRDFGVVNSSSLDQSTKIMEAVALTGDIEFPNNFAVKCNIDLSGMEGIHLRGKSQGQGTDGARLIPADNSKPVLLVADNAIDCFAENFFFDSLASGSYSHIGTAIKFSALSPKFVWRCGLRHIFMRGFDRGFEIACDINAGEVFGNYFEDLEGIGCNSYGFKTLGVYNVFTKMTSTQTGDRAFYNEGSNSVFNSIVGDGRMTFAGGGQHVTNAVIESIYGGGAGGLNPAMELNGNTSTFRGIRLTEVPNAKYGRGVSIFGLQQDISDIVVEGTNFPTQAVVLNAGSSGNITNASAPGGTTQITSTASAAVLGAYTFNGDVSSIYRGHTGYTPVLTPAGGSITATLGAHEILKSGNRVTGGASFAVTAVSSPTTVLTVTGIPATYAPYQDTAVTIFADGLDAGTAGPLQGIILAGATTITINTFAAGVKGNAAPDIIVGSKLTISFDWLV